MEQNNLQGGMMMPKNYLVESILVTVFCCNLFGIVAIAHAAQVNSHLQAGNMEAAGHASAEAKKWIKYSFIIGIILFSIVILIYAIAGISALSQIGDFNNGY